MSETGAPPTIAELLQLGLFHHRRGEHGPAVERYSDVLRLDPQNAEALYYCAAIACQEGQIKEGIDLARRALAAGPAQARMHNLIGKALERQGDHLEAVKSFDAAIALDPDFAEAHGNRAAILADAGLVEEALQGFDRALALDPAATVDWINRAGALKKLGRHGEALASYDKALALEPQSAPAHFNRAALLKDAGRMEEACAGFARAAQLGPRVAEFHVNHALSLKELGRFEEALAAIDRAIARRPDYAEAHAYRGSILGRAGRASEAITSFEQALALNPDLPSTLHDYALVQIGQGDIAPARAKLERAAKLAPRDHEIAVALAEVQLLQGDWRAGFVNFEHRSNTKRPSYLPLRYPRWAGEQPGDYRLVLVGEQGMGNIILFSSYAVLMARRSYPVTLLAPPLLAPLLRGLAGVEVLTDVPELAQDPRPIRWLPLMSLMLHLYLKPDTVSQQVPYLAADPARAADWRARLGTHGFKVGLLWQGRTNRRDNPGAVPLTELAPLAAIPDVRLISLQRGPASRQIGEIAFADRIEQPLDADDMSAEGVLDMAALISNLDLVVSIDAMPAHLAGALGRPVFLALPFAAHWRWLTEREDTPWYPTMRLFRQDASRQWGSVTERIAEALRERLAGVGAMPSSRDS